MNCLDLMKLDAENRHANGLLYTIKPKDFTLSKLYSLAELNNYLSLMHFDFKGYVVAGGIFSATKQSLVGQAQVKQSLVRQTQPKQSSAEQSLANKPPSDLDIFIYENHDEVLLKLTNKLRLLGDCRYFLTKYTSDFYITDISVDFSLDGFTSEPANNHRNEPYKIQIIHRKYTTIAEILYGFDIGPGQIAFDGEKLHLTILGKLAYDAGIMIADTTRRSTTYEKRLTKYAYRGFELILPFCKPINTSVNDISNNRDMEGSRYFLFGYKDKKFYPTNTFVGSDREYNASPYVYNHTFNINNTNRAFFKGIGNNFCFKNGQFSALDKTHFLEWYEQYFTSHYSLIDPNQTDNIITIEASALIKLAVDAMKKKMEEVFPQVDIPIFWITENPGTQTREINNKDLSCKTITNKDLPCLLTASINPIFEDPSEWYGGYYYPVWTPETAHLRPDIVYEEMLPYLDVEGIAHLQSLCQKLDKNHPAKKMIYYKGFD